MMSQPLDYAAVAKTIIDTTIYMVLGTADESGIPWVSPVYYACHEYTDFYWVSSPDARHSKNISVRPQVSIVIFDSRAPIGTGQGIYMETLTGELSGDELQIGIEIYSSHSLAHGGGEWNLQDILPPAPYRLYRATATRYWVLDRDGHPDRRKQIIL